MPQCLLQPKKGVPLCLHLPQLIFSPFLQVILELPPPQPWQITTQAWKLSGNNYEYDHFIPTHAQEITNKYIIYSTFNCVTKFIIVN